MKKKTYGMIIGLSLLIILSAIDIFARGGSTARNTTVRSSSSGFHGSASFASHGGFGKVAARGGGYTRGGYHGSTSTWSGFRGGRNHYYPGFHHGYYHGYYGWGSYWPYWSIGSYLTYLPDDYTTVYVDGTPYYYCDGSYFTPYSSGYMVVPTPAAAASQDQEATVQAPSSTETDKQPIAAQPESASHDTTTINIPNSKGGFTPVRLVKHKNGYIGPQGEFYTGHPTVAALKALYGD
jgi:hypothetical protein